jgi:WhiB family transcriptional regulator, redox-sensing transcriptional regulator
MKAWMNLATCRGMDSDLFFPIGPEAGRQAEEAKKICRRCPVREACLDEALTKKIKDGIWGGTTEGEREKITRRLRRAAA